MIKSNQTLDQKLNSEFKINFSNDTTNSYLIGIYPWDYNVDKIEFASGLTNVVEKVSEYRGVIKSAFLNLMDSRDFLGFQLDHALENIDDLEFKEIAQQYLIKENLSLDELIRKIKIFESIIGIPLDLDLTTELFKCELDLAEEALKGKNLIS